MFSSQEHDEILRIVRSNLNLALVGRRIGEAIESNPNAASENPGSGARPLYYESARRWIESMHTAGFGFGSIVNAPGTGGHFPPRPERVQEAFGQFSGALGEMSGLRSSIETWPDTGSGDKSQALFSLDNAIEEMAAFDTTLSYLAWEPPAFPRIVGPHGDYLTGQRHLHRTYQYLMQTTRDGILWYGTTMVIPVAALEPMRLYFRHAHESLISFFNGWSLASQIILAENRADIEADEAAGSGLRPFSFFVEPLAIEWLYNKADAVNFAGRTLKQGANGGFFRMANSFANAVDAAAQVNGEDELRKWLTQGPKTFNKITDIGRVKEFLVDLGDFWNDHDNYAPALQVFFHEIPPLPDGGEPPPCPEYKAVLELTDESTAIAKLEEI